MKDLAEDSFQEDEMVFTPSLESKLRSRRVSPISARKKLEYLCDRLRISSEQAIKVANKSTDILRSDLSQRVPYFISFFKSQGLDLEDISKIFIGFPSIIGYDHDKKLRQKVRVGRILGKSREEVLEYLVKNPVSFGYSQRRDVGILEVLRELQNNDRFVDEKVLRVNISRKSPYVEGGITISEYRRENGLSKNDKIDVSVFPPLYQALYEGRVTRRKKVEA